MAAPPLLEEFTLFPDLPLELRLAIWEFVPQLPRVVGQVPCSYCWINNNLLASRSHGRDWAHHRRHRNALRYMVQPRQASVFPPLHACRESRAVWLRRYTHSPSGDGEGRGVADRGDIPLPRFMAPFISYEDDIFAVFDAWSVADMDRQLSGVGPGHLYLPSSRIDPFIGLDRSRIRHVAVSETPVRFLDAVQLLRLDTLPRLQTLSVLIPGPDPDPPLPGNRWVKILAPNAQDADCTLLDLSDQLVTSHPFFTSDRLWPPHAETKPPDKPPGYFATLLKAWLWHDMRARRRDGGLVPAGASAAPAVVPAVSPRAEMIATIYHEFLAYVFQGKEGDACPLERDGIWPPPGLDGRGNVAAVGAHSREEMLGWQPAPVVDFKLLCETTWLRTLEDLAVFKLDADAAGSGTCYDTMAYVKFKTEVLARK